MHFVCLLLLASLFMVDCDSGEKEAHDPVLFKSLEGPQFDFARPEDVLAAKITCRETWDTCEMEAAVIPELVRLLNNNYRTPIKFQQQYDIILQLRDSTIVIGIQSDALKYHGTYHLNDTTLISQITSRCCEGLNEEFIQW